MQKAMLSSGPMLNAYPDSLGGNLGALADFLEDPRVRGAFSGCYLLPSLFNTDLDRGFSVIDYSLNKALASREDLERIKKLGIGLKLDFILNHASVLSPQFQDVLKNGEASPYRDFFIDWNKFWEGCGEMTEEGYIQPDPEYLAPMFFRKPGLPLLMVRMPDGRKVPYWNTFYQSVSCRRPTTQQLMEIAGLQYGSAERLHTFLNEALDRGEAPEKIDFGPFAACKDRVVTWLEQNREYLGQMDLNIHSPLVWEFYENTLTTLSDYGADIVRLDAFAYAPKAPGRKNFLNDPETWELLEQVRQLADPHGLQLLPEIHASYQERIHEKVAEQGYLTYDFFLPGLMLDAFERQSGQLLCDWARELWSKQIRTVNMLGCHDGIPLLDLKGLLPDDRIEFLIDRVVGRGGYVKNLHGQKGVYYQVNATYYSALGEDPKKLLLARAIQMFMPGKPQVWYLDLFAGKNDHEAVRRAGEGGHKEINRTNLSTADVQAGLQTELVQRQLELLRLRNTCPAFGFDAELTACCSGSVLTLQWQRQGAVARLTADFSDFSFEIEAD